MHADAWLHTPYGDYILTDGEITYQTFSLDKNNGLKKPLFFGDPPETRTPDNLIKSQVLYHLS